MKKQLLNFREYRKQVAGKHSEYGSRYLKSVYGELADIVPPKVLTFDLLTEMYSKYKDSKIHKNGS